MEDENDQTELQLLPSPPARRAHLFNGSAAPASVHPPPTTNLLDTPSLDLQLSISSRPWPAPPRGAPVPAAQSFGEMKVGQNQMGNVEALKRQAAEQIRLAAVEKAYAERVRELTRREMELAESEFARARHVWERAQQEIETAQRMKEKATSRVDPTCVQITCQSCRRRFRP